MLLLAVAAAIAATQPNALQTASDKSAEQCKRTTAQFANSGKSVAPQNLTKLPDSNVYLTVYRRIDGCEAPIVVKYGVNRR